MAFHAATHHPPVDSTEEDTGPTVTPDAEYFGIVSDTHVAIIESLAARSDVPRVLKSHPRDPSQFFVLRDDGFLDHYKRVVEGE